MAVRVPIVRWLPSYDRRWLRGDIAAGIAVTALIVPRTSATRGSPACRCRTGCTRPPRARSSTRSSARRARSRPGPSSSLAAVAGGAVVVAGLAGEQAAELVAAIALVTGLLFLALALLRMGWISRFLSKAVITGFLAGAAVDVVIGELSKLTGTDAEGDNAWRELGSWIGSLGDIHGATLAVGVARARR